MKMKTNQKMKSLVTVLLIWLAVVNTASSQNNNVVVYSQDGYRFSLILNGVLQNGTPATNVKVTGLNATNYQAKIIFENKMPDVNGNIYLMWGGNTTANTEYSYAIVNVKGAMKLRMKSTEPLPIQVNATPEPQQTIVIYTTVPPPVNVETTTVTSTTETTTVDQGGNVGINISIPTDGTIHTTTGGASTTSTYSTTTTTTTSGGVVMNSTQPSGYVLQGYNGVYGCPYPMSDADFQSAKQTISSKGFDDSKLTIAKQIIGSNCMLCSQIKEMMLLMSFEGTKLELAKFAWHHNLDKGNYYKLNDAFSFESSISDLNTYTQSH
jgi:Domain of unknown function (DUF4476)